MRGGGQWRAAPGLDIASTLRTLDDFDQTGTWLFSSRDLQRVHEAPENTVEHALRRHVNSGLIIRVTRGLYANPRARSLPRNPLAAVAAAVRPDAWNYISLETALAIWANEERQTQRAISVITSGRKGILHTPYGRLELVHTKRIANDTGQVTIPGWGLPVASRDLAEADIRRIRGCTLAERVLTRTSTQAGSTTAQQL